MRILVTGASGLIGSAFCKSAATRGVEIIRASRKPAAGTGSVRWDPESGFDLGAMESLEGLDAVIHLAGESVSGLRWSDEKKKAIRDSRVQGTRSVVGAIAKLKRKPAVFISASAIGFYGDRGDEELTEASPPGETFLAEVCVQWETESRRAEDLGVRTVLLRNGIVLSKDGGALATMLLPFKLGLGGVIGSGRQWMSWISLDEVVAIMEFVLANESLRGGVNVVSPNPVRNQEFTKILGEVLYRPTFLPVPEFAVHMLLGEMGDALLLDSTRVVPKRLLDAGYEFRFSDLKAALENALR
ncbi:MAG: TIGR01777 family protein [Blastocatellia bacterium]